MLPKLVARRYRKLARRASHAQAATGNDRAGALHQTRKSAKQLRYAADAVEQAFGRPAADLAKQAKGIQEILGEHQDSVVAAERLKVLAIAANDAAGESAFTYGLLAGLEQESGNRGPQKVRQGMEASRPQPPPPPAGLKPRRKSGEPDPSICSNFVDGAGRTCAVAAPAVS